MDETGENHRTAASHIITLCYIEYIFLILFVDTVLYVYTNEKYEMKGEKKNVDIKFLAHDAFLE